MTTILWLLPLWIIAASSIGISGAIHRLADHHEKFIAPADEADEHTEAL